MYPEIFKNISLIYYRLVNTNSRSIGSNNFGKKNFNLKVHTRKKKKKKEDENKQDIKFLKIGKITLTDDRVDFDWK